MNITVDRAVIEQALEALENVQGLCTDANDGWVEAVTIWTPEAITALRAALEKPEQEPVATVTSETGAEISMSWWHEPALPVGTKLYTAPPQRKPLTDDEIDLALLPFDRDSSFYDIARAIEAAHNIKD